MLKKETIVLFFSLDNRIFLLLLFYTTSFFESLKKLSFDIFNIFKKCDIINI